MYIYSLLAVAPLVLGGSVAERAGPKVLAGAPVNDIRVASDNVNQCAQATITWTGASSPVKVQVGTGGYYVGTTWLQEFDDVSGNSQSWTVTQPAGTDLIFQITDSKGQVAYQQGVNVGDSSDSSCLVDAGASEAPASSTTWSSAAADASSAWSEPAETSSSSSRTRSKASSAAAAATTSSAQAAPAASTAKSSAAASSAASETEETSPASSTASAAVAASSATASAASAVRASSAVSSARASASSSSAPAGDATLAAAESSPTNGAVKNHLSTGSIAAVFGAALAVFAI